jgi:CRP-like cAMP-binding protein
MGLKQSIHDINVYNAVSYNEDIIPINKMNKINSIYSHMKNQFNMPTNGIIDKNRINTTRYSKKQFGRFSDILLRTTSKRPNIIENIEQEKETFKLIKIDNKERNDEKLINDCLLSHFFMQYLNKQARITIIEEMSLIQVDKNNYIIKQGDIGNYFYILQSGLAQLLVNNKKVRILRSGESFGELALLHDAPRSGSIKAITDCLLWTLERKNFRKIVEHITKINYEENLKFIESVSILSHMEQYQKTILSTNIVKEEFLKGRIIVKKGEISSCLYIIKNGCVDCIDENGIIIRTLKEGDNFGERSILVDTKRTLDVVAKTNCICYSISISTLKSMLGEKYRSFLYLNFMKTAFQNSKLLNNLNTYFIEDVFKFFEAVNLGSDNVAFPIKHNKSSNIVIVIDGNLINVRIYLNYFII